MAKKYTYWWKNGKGRPPKRIHLLENGWACCDCPNEVGYTEEGVEPPDLPMCKGSKKYVEKLLESVVDPASRLGE